VTANPLAQTAVGGTLLSNGLLVAIVALVHIQIATYITGSCTIAWVSEAISIARGGDERHDRLATSIVRSWAYIFAFGSAIGIFFVMLVLLGFWGKFFVALQQITFGAFFFESIAFLVEVALIYTLYANWERLRRYRRARLGMLILLNIDLFWQMFFIDVVASFMLTPNGGDANLLDQFLNPSNIPLTIHRTIGNVAWAGAVLAFAGAFQYLRASRGLEPAAAPARAGAPVRSVGAMDADEAPAEPPEVRETRHWDWVGQWGAIWVVGLTTLQPWVGYSYAKEVQLHAYPAWYDMMFGDLSNVFLFQLTLLGTIFTVGTAYFWRRMKASGATHHRRQGVIAILLAVVTLFAAQPAWFAWTYADVVAQGLARPWWQGGLLNPIGNFIPYKVGALFALVFLGLASVTSYMRAYSRDEMKPGRVGRRNQGLLLALGVVVSTMMIVMGVIREHSRQPFLISGELTIQHQQTLNNQPSQLGGTAR